MFDVHILEAENEDSKEFYVKFAAEGPARLPLHRRAAVAGVLRHTLRWQEDDLMGYGRSGFHVLTTFTLVCSECGLIMALTFPIDKGEGIAEAWAQRAQGIAMSQCGWRLNKVDGLPMCRACAPEVEDDDS